MDELVAQLSVMKRRKQTRPDTRQSVADGWAGADMRVFPLFDLCPRTNQPTNQPTIQRTDKASYRVACPQLKTRPTPYNRVRLLRLKD